MRSQAHYSVTEIKYLCGHHQIPTHWFNKSNAGVWLLYLRDFTSDPYKVILLRILSSTSLPSEPVTLPGVPRDRLIRMHKELELAGLLVRSNHERYWVTPPLSLRNTTRALRHFDAGYASSFGNSRWLWWQNELLLAAISNDFQPNDRRPQANAVWPDPRLTRLLEWVSCLEVPHCNPKLRFEVLKSLMYFGAE